MGLLVIVDFYFRFYYIVQLVSKSILNMYRYYGVGEINLWLMNFEGKFGSG